MRKNSRPKPKLALKNLRPSWAKYETEISECPYSCSYEPRVEIRSASSSMNKRRVVELTNPSLFFIPHALGFARIKWLSGPMMLLFPYKARRDVPKPDMYLYHSTESRSSTSCETDTTFLANQA